MSDGRKARAYRARMEISEQECALCGRPIDVGEAWMRSDEEGSERVAHSGCVYSDSDVAGRDRWMPPE